MNLVAKEFVAARDDEQGVLMLSSFAGASRELAEALIVNPYDAREMAAALDAGAASCRQPEQRERMRLMREHRARAQCLSLGRPDAARRRRPEKAQTHHPDCVAPELVCRNTEPSKRALN